MNPNLNDLQDLARGAGELLRQGYGAHNRVEYKGVIDPVTDVDRRSEEYLIRHIREQFPGHRIVTEESGLVEGEECCAWIIDPLDGTVNFAHGVPIFCVSIAFMVDGSVEMGVVYDPLRDECFSAQRGQGAWLNGRPIRVSETPTLDASLLVTGFPYTIRTSPRNNLNYYARFALISQGVRRLGSAALDMCYIAAGRFDGYWEIYLEVWDMAAGILIASEAGARVTDVTGDEKVLTPPLSILMANSAVHAEMLDVLRSE